MDVINNDGRFIEVSSIEENINLLKIEDTEIELEYSKDNEVKNAKLKNNYEYGKANACGLSGITL